MKKIGRECIGAVRLKHGQNITDRSVFEVFERERKEAGVSISTLCRAAGMSRVAFYKWRNGGGIMPETLAKLRAALGVLQKNTAGAHDCEKRAAIGRRNSFRALNNARRSAGVGVVPLCEAAGVGLGTFYQWKKGRAVGPEKQAKLREALARLADKEGA